MGSAFRKQNICNVNAILKVSRTISITLLSFSGGSRGGARVARPTPLILDQTSPSPPPVI